MAEFLTESDKAEILAYLVAGAYSDQIAEAYQRDETGMAKFWHVVETARLDPRRDEIYAVVRQGKVTTQVGVAGLRVLAERTGEYQGQTPPQWCGEDGRWCDVWLAAVAPHAARIGIWRTGFREPLVRVALWASSVQRDAKGGPNKIWRERGPGMLLKCAESDALRAAFPQALGGLYERDEAPEEVPPPAPSKPSIAEKVAAAAAPQVPPAAASSKTVASKPTGPAEATDAQVAQVVSLALEVDYPGGVARLWQDLGSAGLSREPGFLRADAVERVLAYLPEKARALRAAEARGQEPEEEQPYEEEVAP